MEQLPSRPSKSKVQRLTRTIVQHKARRLKHIKALTKAGLTLEEKQWREEGIAIQSMIIDKLKKLREETRNG